MKRIKLHVRFLLAACFLMATFGAYAQTATLKVVVPEVVSVGERFQVVFESNLESLSRFAPPVQFENLKLLAGPMTSSFRQVSNVNGKTVEVSGTQVIYLFTAVKEGKAVIAEAEAEYDGRVCRSKPVTIDVVKGEAPRSGDAQGGAAASAEDDIYVRVSLNKSTTYKGDCLIATVKVFVKGMQIANFEELKFPTFNGFYAQELESPTQLSMQRENIGGKLYNTALIRSYLLYPQQAGTLKIDPFEATVNVVRDSRSRTMMDDFFAAQQPTARKHLVSPPVTVTVQNLPAGAPASFTGAVGNFKLETNISKPTVTANSALSFYTKISGTGNFKLFEAPKVSLPSDFEVYEPKSVDNIKNSYSGLSGSRQFETTVIPRSAGSFTIPPVEFTYFNPEKNQYITLSSNELTLTVQKDSLGNQSVAMPTSRQQDIKYLGTDIRACKVNPQHWRAVGSVFYGNMTYYSLYLIVLALFIFAVLMLKERAKRRQDTVQMRTRKANGIAKKRLSLADKLLRAGNISGFHEELLKAYWGYLSDKLGIPVSELSRDSVREVLSKKKVDVEDIDAFIAVVDGCEFARYAPAGSQSEVEQEYKNALGVITKLEQKIR